MQGLETNLTVIEPAQSRDKHGVRSIVNSVRIQQSQ
jgi:hypothetical protein